MVWTWLAIGVTLLLPWAAGAQTAPAPADAACRLAAPPDTLLSLSRCCAAAVAANPGCRGYDAAHGYVIIKDNARTKPVAYLIIPTAVVTGIEDAQVFSPAIADLWQFGWEVGQRTIGAPPAASAMAINSQFGRTQNQFHIHISCVRPDVAAGLARAQIGTDPAHPAALPLGPDAHVYRAIRVRGLAGDDNPFRAVAAMPGTMADFGSQSVAVIGSSEPGIWYLVDTQAGIGNPGSAEELLEQRCGAATQTVPVGAGGIRIVLLPLRAGQAAWASASAGRPRIMSDALSAIISVVA